MSEQSIQIRRLQPLIGAEISGVDLREPLSAATGDAIRQALADYQVLVFRDQDVTREQQIEFAKLWSLDKDNPFLISKVQGNPIEGYPEITHVVADGVKKMAADIWHTDESFHRCPPTASVLRARVTPSLGGDTLFSSAIVAYERLPDDVKEKIRYLKAWHGALFQYYGGLADPEKIERHIRDNPPVAQPVVRLHPVTRKPLLYVNTNYTGPIIGLVNEESDRLRTYLFDQFKRPDYQLRVSWQPNTIVVWDNASVQHYAVYDYNEPRRMERLLCTGTEPALGFEDIERAAPRAVANG